MLKTKTCKKCKASFVPEKKEEDCKECLLLMKGGKKQHGRKQSK